VVQVAGTAYPDRLHYDVENQIWYEALADGTLRAGFTPWAVALMGEVLAFTPKRLGRPFQKGRAFAVIEGGKWVGTARAAFDGTVAGVNEELIRRPRLLMQDAWGEGWMLLVRPDADRWHDGLVTGAAVEPAFAAWIASEAFKDRTKG
jgi:glycine cleavage system H protein